MIVIEILKGAWESIRETFPRTEQEAGIFLSAMCWTFAVHWVLLIAVTWAHCSRTGTC